MLSKGSVSRMMRSKGVMVSRVPVLGKNHMAKQAGKSLNDGYHLLSARHGKRTTIAKIILYIHDQQNIAIDQFDAHPFNLSQKPYLTKNVIPTGAQAVRTLLSTRECKQAPVTLTTKLSSRPKRPEGERSGGTCFSSASQTTQEI